MSVIGSGVILCMRGQDGKVEVMQAQSIWPSRNGSCIEVPCYKPARLYQNHTSELLSQIHNPLK